MIKIERLRTTQLSTSIIVAAGSIILSLLISAIVLKIMDYEPFKVFSITFSKTYFQKNGILENIVMLVPLSLCALSVVIAAKAGLWNIGVEGQFFAGAIGATGIAMAFPNLPSPILITLMFITGAAVAGIICYISVLPKVYLGISEILTTILMNSIILYFVKYFVYSAWKDPGTVAAQTPEFVDAAKLGILIPGSRVHFGLIIAIVIIIACHYFIKKSVYGYELRAVGENHKGATYAGINAKKYFFLSMFISGCLAGAAGMLEVSGIVHRLQPTISADYGFSAFVIAWIARLDVLAIIVISYLFSGLIVAGFKMQMMGLPGSIIFMIKGLVLLFILGGEVLTLLKFTWVRKDKEAPAKKEQ